MGFDLRPAGAPATVGSHTTWSGTARLFFICFGFALVFHLCLLFALHGKTTTRDVGALSTDEPAAVSILLDAPKVIPKGNAPRLSREATVADFHHPASLKSPVPGPALMPEPPVHAESFDSAPAPAETHKSYPAATSPSQVGGEIDVDALVHQAATLDRASRIGEEYSIPAEPILQSSNHRFESAVKQAARPACKDEYAGSGLVGAAFILRDAMSGKGCKL